MAQTLSDRALRILALAASILAGCADAPAPSAPAATFVGRETCATCHADEAAAWKGSHHDLAMQEASEATVLGDFDDATFTHFGVTTTFSKKDGQFRVRTDGPDGELHDYRIAYTFGAEPLQQYLVDFPDGRKQALGICWDTRPADQGGQRWFHLYPDGPVPHTDELHWTGVNQNWNSMCAECHSTGLRRGYDAANDRYDTTWEEIDVSCEACHGPGSDHVAWAGRPEAERDEDDKGLVVNYLPRALIRWDIDMETGTAKRDDDYATTAEIEACARCHSRRDVLTDEYAHGRPLLDSHRPVVLHDPLYHADGQIREEVYVYGSFLQSRMHAEGVTCRDCHDPHTLRTYESGNDLCARCHAQAGFDTIDHHHHKPGSPGASCVACHMPETTYMLVDGRRDHSIRIPRPDLTAKIGAPNACNGCHQEETTQWAIDAVAKWYGPELGRKSHYGVLLHSARIGTSRVRDDLFDPAKTPPIVRATALTLLTPDSAGIPDRAAVKAALFDADPLIRWAAVTALDVIPARRFSAAEPLLSDPILAVRAEAGRRLARIPAAALAPEQAARRDLAVDEYIAVQRASADRPSARLELGVFFAETGRSDDAETEYRAALRLDRRFVAAYANLADLFRERGRDDEAERILRDGLDAAPGNGDLHHALGLTLVRLGRTGEARDELRLAAESSPEATRYTFVHAVALRDGGDLAAAVDVLREAVEHHPREELLLSTLVRYLREQGDLEAAVDYCEMLVHLNPRHRFLLLDLRRQRE